MSKSIYDFKVSTVEKPKEWSSKKGANELAKKIEKYWLERGYVVRTHIENMTVKKYKDNDYELYAVRSSLVNGLPQLALIRTTLDEVNA